MEEETRGGPPPVDKKQKANCVINIFCNEKKPDQANGAWGSQEDGCVINIFCDDKKKHHGPGCDQDDDGCTINIFCNDKKPEPPSCHNDSW